MAAKQTAAYLRAQSDALRRKAKAMKKSGREKKLKTFSHIVMAGIMMMFFVGVALGVYVTILRGEPVNTTLDYIMKLAYIVSLGYFIKAFGENIAKIVLSFIFGKQPADNSTDGTTDENNNEQGGVG